MKLTYKILLTLGLIASSNAATLIFTEAGIPRFASGFADAGGSDAAGLAWGIVVDTGGDGFQSAAYDGGFVLTGGAETLLPVTGGARNDVLVMHTALTVARTNGDGILATSSSGSIGTISTVDFTNGIAGNMPFAIIWFDRGIALNSTVADGAKFGLITQGTVASPAFLLPAASSGNPSFSAAFAGADPIKTAALTIGGEVVPETSTSLLGALGALALLRRRRN